MGITKLRRKYLCLTCGYETHDLIKLRNHSCEGDDDETRD